MLTAPPFQNLSSGSLRPTRGSDPRSEVAQLFPVGGLPGRQGQRGSRRRVGRRRRFRLPRCSGHLGEISQSQYRGGKMSILPRSATHGFPQAGGGGFRLFFEKDAGPTQPPCPTNTLTSRVPRRGCSFSLDQRVCWTWGLGWLSNELGFKKKTGRRKRRPARSRYSSAIPRRTACHGRVAADRREKVAHARLGKRSIFEAPRGPCEVAWAPHPSNLVGGGGT